MAEFDEGTADGARRHPGTGERTVRLSGEREDGPRSAWREEGEAEAFDLTCGPQRVGQLLDHTVDLFLQHFGKLFLVSVVIWFPLRVLLPMFGPQVMEEADPTAGMFFGLALTVLATGLATVFLKGLVTVYVYSRLEGRPTTLIGSIPYVLKRLFVLCIVAFVVGLASVFAVLLVIVGMVLVSWLFYLGTTVAVIEREGPFSSIGRSVELSKGKVFASGSPFWAWCAIMGTVQVMIMPIAGIAGAGDQPMVQAWIIENLNVGPRVFNAILLLLSTMANSVAIVFVAIATTVWYVDRRVRREALDLFVSLDALRAETEPGRES